MSRVRSSQWPPKEWLELKSRLEELEQLVSQPVNSLDQDTRDWLARLLVVRSCGFLEQTALSVTRGYLAHRSSGPVRSFSFSWLDRGRNPTPEALVVLAGRFDARWSEELSEILEADDQRLRREVAFLVDRRNKIAHGENEGIGIVKAIELKDVACELADWFVLRFNPGR